MKLITPLVTPDDDALLSSLTARETLHFAANLRLPMWMSLSDKIKRVESVMHEMPLKDCADVVVGSDLKK